MTKLAITVGYECNKCHRKTKTVKYNGDRFNHNSELIGIGVKGWFIYDDDRGGNDNHECPTCHKARLKFIEQQKQWKVCPDCGGNGCDGGYSDMPCGRCNGSGRINRDWPSER